MLNVFLQTFQIKILFWCKMQIFSIFIIINIILMQNKKCSKYHRDAKGEVPSSPRPSLDPLSASLHSCCSNCGEQTQISSKHPCCSKKIQISTEHALQQHGHEKYKCVVKWKHCYEKYKHLFTAMDWLSKKTQSLMHWSKDVYSIVYTDPSYSRQVEVWQGKDYHQKICNLSSSPFCKTCNWMS